MDPHDAMKALAHPMRLEFLAWLKQPAQHFVAETVAWGLGVPAGQFERSGLSQSAASQHLSVLHRAGLVSTRRLGSQVLYARDEENLALLKTWLSEHL
ncbi:helix-turn-helix domain-containing protein (plasmid) [Agrobacterium sp. MA01]|uniref:ArsR/SmtB family transcription factor n=1 Tax=Agrobacterium sp. MA01 TaxID=2664893 RepID=UPI00129BED81|nr:helix-turn-helix domain-containing protein [Agrobacterium sp. MA01]QGG93352.1 helix-turn-helix domain-containing protein [Agrobacterium sp. MA01]